MLQKKSQSKAFEKQVIASYGLMMQMDVKRTFRPEEFCQILQYIVLKISQNGTNSTFQKAYVISAVYKSFHSMGLSAQC